MAAPDRPPVAWDLPRLTPRIDGSLTEWPAAASVTPWVSDSLEEHVNPGHRYRIAVDDTQVYLGAEINDARLDDPGEDWRWEGDALALYVTRSGTGADADEGSASVYLYRTGGGKDHHQPYAAFWEDAVPGAVVMTRTREGGFTLEASLPRTALRLTGTGSGTVALNYRDVSGIYETWWDGKVTWPAGPGPSHQ
jgi:hypothetical protein